MRYPRVKLCGVVVYIAAVFIINNIFGLLFIIAALGVLIYLSKVPLKHIMKGLRFVWFLVIVAIFFNLFFSEGDIIWRWWIFHMSRQGILRAAFFAVRLVCVIVGSSMLTYTTTPTNLTAGLEKVMKPLNKINFPGHEIAMMMSIALRFIPILSEEINKIIKAQLARGADFDSGGIIMKAKGMIPIMIPLGSAKKGRKLNVDMRMARRAVTMESIRSVISLIANSSFASTLMLISETFR